MGGRQKEWRGMRAWRRKGERKEGRKGGRKEGEEEGRKEGEEEGREEYALVGLSGARACRCWCCWWALII